ncbi:hypothetical protein HETIRDRAFT_439399, partial [Heterobasidion irregulare TC 32-1]
VEGQWSGVCEEWAEERARISSAREDWEARVRAAEEGFDGAVAKVDAGLATLQQHTSSRQTGTRATASGSSRLPVRAVSRLTRASVIGGNGRRPPGADRVRTRPIE